MKRIYDTRINFKTLDAIEKSNLRIKEIENQLHKKTPSDHFETIIERHVHNINQLYQNKSHSVLSEVLDILAHDDFIAKLNLSNHKSVEVKSLFKDAERLERRM